MLLKIHKFLRELILCTTDNYWSIVMDLDEMVAMVSESFSN